MASSPRNRTRDKRAYYLINHERLKRKAKDRYQLGSAVLDGERARGCTDCGERDLRVLDFDHVRGEKRFDIGKSRMMPVAALYAEIDKCEVRCANCHRRITAQRRAA